MNKLRVGLALASLAVAVACFLGIQNSSAVDTVLALMTGLCVALAGVLFLWAREK